MVTQGVIITVDAQGSVVQPGFVDCHVHVSQHLGRGTIDREARGKMPTISAEQAMEMAPINAARSLGLADQVGSLKEGQKADIVVHTYRRPEWRPCLDVMNSLIYSAQSVGVDPAIVVGEMILEGGRFTRVDEEAEYCHFDRAARELYKRMGFEIHHRWPIT